MEWKSAARRLSRWIDAANRPPRFVFEHLDATLGVAASALTLPLELMLSAPFLGRGLSQLWKLVLAVVWAAVHLPYGLLALIGIQPEMHLRVHFLVGTRDGQVPETVRSRVWGGLNVAARILKREANVKVDVVVDSTLRSVEGEGPVLAWHAVGSELGLVACNLEALWEDLGPVGGRLGRAAVRAHPRGSYRRMTGWGAPLAIVLVDQVQDGLAGCSLGPLTDYVTVQAQQPVCTAHELAHACNLWHRSAPQNLMNPTCGGVHLARWQVALLRMSRHVTAW